MDRVNLHIHHPLPQGTSADIVAIGASLGGLHALSLVLGHLPADFPVPILIVQHLPDDSPRTLVSILRERTSLNVQWAQAETHVHPATVYLAPPSHHLRVNAAGTLLLSEGAKVNFARPSVDLLFESVATSYQTRAIGVILTGRLSDGAKGVEAIQARGGRILVQEPASAQARGMPQAALQTGAANFMLPLDWIASALITFCMVAGALSLFSGSMPLKTMG